jgi:hypothetical protein
MRLAAIAWVMLVLGAACSAQPKVDASAACYVDTDKSMEIIEPTVFAKVHLSTDADAVVPFVRVEMFDDQGHDIGEERFSAGLLTEHEPKDVVYPIGIPSGGIRAFSSCTASVIGTDGHAD